MATREKTKRENRKLAELARAKDIIKNLNIAIEAVYDANLHYDIDTTAVVREIVSIKHQIIAKS